MIIHSKLPDDDCEVLYDFCDDNFISVSALTRVLIDDFLNNADSKEVKRIINEAHRIKVGRRRKDR